MGFSLMALLILSMSVGVIFARKPIKGTCGGIASLRMDSSCDICGGDMSKCEEENATGAPGSLAYDATKK